MYDRFHFTTDVVVPLFIWTAQSCGGFCENQHAGFPRATGGGDVTHDMTQQDT